MHASMAVMFDLIIYHGGWLQSQNPHSGQFSVLLLSTLPHRHDVSNPLWVCVWTNDAMITCVIWGIVKVLLHNVSLTMNTGEIILALF